MVSTFAYYLIVSPYCADTDRVTGFRRVPIDRLSIDHNFDHEFRNFGFLEEYPSGAIFDEPGGIFRTTHVRTPAVKEQNLSERQNVHTRTQAKEREGRQTYLSPPLRLDTKIGSTTTRAVIIFFFSVCKRLFHPGNLDRIIEIIFLFFPLTSNLLLSSTSRSSVFAAILFSRHKLSLSLWVVINMCCSVSYCWRLAMINFYRKKKIYLFIKNRYGICIIIFNELFTYTNLTIIIYRRSVVKNIIITIAIFFFFFKVRLYIRYLNYNTILTFEKKKKM